MDRTTVPRHIRRLLLPAMLFLVLPIRLAGSEAAAEDNAQRRAPSGGTGLALSAGAARGLAHAGVLKVLEERGIRIDCIAGTSMGAVIGALYASGYSPAEIEAVVRSVDWQEVFSDRPERPQIPLDQRIDHVPAVGRLGIDSGRIELPRAIESDYRINRLLIKLLTGPGLAAGGDFDRLPIPFRSVAADLRTGEKVIASKGSLARAVRASISIPVALPPVEDGNRTLVDGGVVDDLPMGVVRGMGARRVIAVDIRMPPLPPEEYQDAIGVVRKLFEVLGRNREAPAESTDLLIVPELGDIGYEDYALYERIMAIGAEGAERALDNTGITFPWRRRRRERPATSRARRVAPHPRAAYRRESRGPGGSHPRDDRHSSREWLGRPRARARGHGCAPCDTAFRFDLARRRAGDRRQCDGGPRRNVGWPRGDPARGRGLAVDGGRRVLVQRGGSGGRLRTAPEPQCLGLRRKLRSDRGSERRRATAC